MDNLVPSHQMIEEIIYKSREYILNDVYSIVYACV